MIISHLTHNTFSVLKENIQRSSRENQKIWWVVAFALTCLAAAYLLIDCYSRVKADEAEFEDDGEENRRGVKKIARYILSDFEEMKRRGIEVEACKVFVTMRCDTEEIKKEFIIQKLTRDPLDKDFVEEKVEKLKECIEKDLTGDLKAWNKLQIMAIFKDTFQRFQFEYHKGDMNRNASGFESKFSESSEENLNILSLMRKYRIFIDSMGIPQEKQVDLDKDEFIPGKYYQALN